MISATKLAESISGEISKKWSERLFSAAMLYWLLVTIAYLIHTGSSNRGELIDALEIALSKSPVPVLVAWTAALGIGGLLLVSGTQAAAERLQFQVLRWLEGYWPKVLDPVLVWGRRRKRQRIEAIDRRWKQLADHYQGHTEAERLEYTKLDRIRSRYPTNRREVMATDLGNVLKEVEGYPRERYGIVAVLFWPRLWLVVSKEIREEIARAQGRVNSGVRGVIFSAALFPWGVLQGWILVAALFGAIASYRHTVGEAIGFGDLAKAAFDIHYRSLLETMGWEPDKLSTTDDPRAVGSAASYFVMRSKLRRPTAPTSAPPMSYATSSKPELVAQIAVLICLMFATLKRLRSTQRS